MLITRYLKDKNSQSSEVIINLMNNFDFVKKFMFDNDFKYFIFNFSSENSNHFRENGNVSFNFLDEKEKLMLLDSVSEYMSVKNQSSRFRNFFKDMLNKYPDEVF